jgi:hypothetical protein
VITPAKRDSSMLDGITAIATVVLALVALAELVARRRK